jgi:hypothetical protein
MLLAGAAAPAGCGPPQAEPSRLIIEPGKIELASPPNAKDIWGSFTIKKSVHSAAIESSGTGGACLLADLNHLGIPTMASPTRQCTSGADCNSFSIPNVTTSSWYGYCDSDGDKKCWVRPGKPPDLCNINGTVRPLNEAIETPHYRLDSLPVDYSRPIRWRVIARLNGKPGGTPAKIEIMGPPRAVPPPG